MQVGIFRRRSSCPETTGRNFQYIFNILSILERSRRREKAFCIFRNLEAMF